MRRAIVTLVCGCVVAGLLAPATARAQYGHGSIVGWGTHVVGGDLSADFVAVAGGAWHSLGLKADGSIVAWGDNGRGQCNVPDPNTDFVAVAAAGSRSLGIKGYPRLLGDLNCDGAVDAFDIDPFVLAVVDVPEYYRQYPDCDHMLGDIDGDGDVDAFDIDPFVELLIGP